MKAVKRKTLEAAGWRVGSAAEFLGLTPDEAALVDAGLREAKRGKKGGRKSFASLSDKHLHDKIKHALRERGNYFKTLERCGLPMHPPKGGRMMWPWFSSEWAAGAIAYSAGIIDRALEEMERRGV